MHEVLTGLFDPTGFSPRKDCGPGWTSPLIWLHVTSDLFIWLAYLSIPLVLLSFTRRRDLPYPRLFVLFALFILACGTTHLIDALIFEYPIYRFAGVMKFVTAVVSWVTVIALVPLVPRVLSAVTAAAAPGAPAAPGSETKAHRVLPATAGARRTRAYIIALLAGVLAVLVRAAIDPLLQDDHIFVVALLAVVYVSWQHGFGPGVACLSVGVVGYAYFFVPPRQTLFVQGFGNQLAVALFFFCGVACAALGDAQRLAQRRARAALATAVARREELESEVVRRRVVEAALRQREADLVAAQRETAEALARLNAFLDNAPLGIAFFDSDLRYVRINTYLAAANGKPVEEHTGRLLIDVLPDFPPEVAEAYRRCAGPAGAPFTTRVQRPDIRSPGATRVWQVTAFPVREPGGDTLGAGVVAEDVTAKLKAEEELRESESRFRSMADSVPALIWVSEIDGRRTYFNKTWLEFTGRPVDQQYGYGWADCIHPDDRDLYLNAYTGAIANRRPFELEYRLRRHDGTDRWVLARGTPRFTPSGGFAGFSGLCLDVTERREAEGQLRDSEAFRRSVFENSPDCLKIFDLDGRVLEMNEAGCQLMELDDFASIRGSRWSEMWPAANRETIRESIEAARAGRVGRFQGFCQTAKGTAKYWDVSVAAIPAAAGTPYRLIGVSRDVTEQRRAEDTIRASELRFRTLTEAVPQMVWTADPKGAITFLNRRWDEYTGAPLAGAGSEEWWGPLLHPDDAERVGAEWKRAVAQQVDMYTVEFRLRRAADGEYRWMLSVAVPLRDVTGAVTEWVGSITDIDDQKRQTQLLERMVRERTVALEGANAALTGEVEERKAAEEQVRAVATELERSNEELEKFAYIASHDLQEPLRKIQAFGDRLRNKCREHLPDNGREYVDRMLSAAGRMRKLIDDLLTFSRVTTQKKPYKRLDLGRLVREVVSDLEVRIGQANGTVRVGTLPVLDADATQMRQLFQNLIANAVKFHRPGVPPVVDVEGELIAPSANGSDPDGAFPMCRIVVRDNGIGFNEKYRERIFDVFQRLHGRDEYEGTGVGLAICRKIVERHGGLISAQSREGEGATFVVTLPTCHINPREALTEDDQPEQTDHDPDGR